MFLDRDGVLIENRLTYITNWTHVEFLPDTFSAMRRLNASPYAVVIVTNQSAVGRGLLSLPSAYRINDEIVMHIVQNGGRVDATYLCPHVPDDKCLCRKPAPGLLLKAAADLHIDLHRSYLVGDAVTDMDAAAAAGACGIFVTTGLGALQRHSLGERSNVVVPGIAAAIERILCERSSCR